MPSTDRPLDQDAPVAALNVTFPPGASNVAEREGSKTAGGLSLSARIRRRFRPEEALFLAALPPSAIITIAANLDLGWAGISSRRIEGGLLRLGIAAFLALTVPLVSRAAAAARRRRMASGLQFLEMTLPFILCVAVYTNLHDTIRWVNPHDIDPWLVAAEDWLFGGQPVVWAQQFITPARTEVFSFFYAAFAFIAPSVVVVLWLSGRRTEAREVLLATIVCFYTGYVLYVLFPAAPPRLYLQAQGYFSRTLSGGLLTNLQQATLDLLPLHASRAAFPSLHAAVSLLSVYYAWRYCRWFAPILIVLVGGLLPATVYLRHHYVVDLIAGAALTPWAVWAAGKLDAWWYRDLPRPHVG